MLKRRLVTVALLALTAGAVALFIANSGEPQTERAAAVPLVGFTDPVEVSRVSLRNPSGAVELAREAGLWRIVAPRRLPADASSVVALVSAVLEADMEPVAGELLPAAVALEPPRFRITLEGAGKRETLLGGARSSFDGRLYVKREPTPQIALAPGALEYELSKSLEQLRDRRLFMIEHEAVRRLEVVLPDGGFVIEREGAELRLVEPLRGPADPELAERLLRAVVNLRARTYPEPGDLERHGARQLAAQLTVLDATNTRLCVRILRAGDGETPTYFALRDGDPEIAEVPAEHLLEQLRAPPLELRDRRLMKFDRDAVAVVHLITPASTVTLRQTSARDWVVESPRGVEPAKESEVFALLFRLWSLRVERLEAPRQIERPAGRIELLGGDGRLLAALSIAAGAGDERWAAADGGLSGPVEGARLDAIAFEREHYADDASP